MKSKNLKILFACQLLGGATAPFIVFSAGLVGGMLSPDPNLVTLPVASFIVGNALTTWIVPFFIYRLGRRGAFRLASAMAVVPSVLGYFAITGSSFYFFCLATMLFGVKIAFVNHYRFAAAENAAVPAEAPKAISLILLGGLFSGFLGPFWANFFREVATVEFAASYLFLFSLDWLAFLVMGFYQSPITASAPSAPKEGFESVTRMEILRRPSFLGAALLGSVSFSVMTLLMTAAPVHLKMFMNHSHQETAFVIQIHVACMFLPSLFSGRLAASFGVHKLAFAGILVFASLAPLATLVDAYWMHIVVMALLGVGWNFLFVAGTSLLQRACAAGSRFKIQGLNDSIVFFVQAVSSLSAGKLLNLFGWQKLVWLSMIPLLVVLFVLWHEHSRASRESKSS